MIEQIDVPNAYLKGELEEEIYTEVPEGFTLPPDQMSSVLRLKKELYGLKQSGQEWNKKISKFLYSIGYLAISGDSCVFYNLVTRVILALYVDDFLIFSKNKTAIAEFKTFFNQVYNKMKDLGPAQLILEIKIRCNRKQIIFASLHTSRIFSMSTRWIKLIQLLHHLMEKRCLH